MKKSKQNKKEKVQKISRFHPKPTEGLSSDQVAKRIEENLVNDSSVKTNKSVGTILFKNIFTFFNMTCLAVALALISVGAYSDLMFLVIVVLNTVIGIVQELKAKKTMDKLSLTNSNFTKVIRDGEEQEIYKTEVVLDDVLQLKPGMQIACDSIVLDGQIEVNESQLKKIKAIVYLAEVLFLAELVQQLLTKLVTITTFLNLVKKQKALNKAKANY